MAVVYDLRGLPDDLPPGIYASRLVREDCGWNANGDIKITLEYVESRLPVDSLFQIVKKRKGETHD